VVEIVGPDGVCWFTISADQVPRYKQLVQEHYGVDIYKQEGLWFGDIDFCIKNGITINYFVQQPGDGVTKIWAYF